MIMYLYLVLSELQDWSIDKALHWITSNKQNEKVGQIFYADKKKLNHNTCGYNLFQFGCLLWFEYRYTLYSSL